MDNIKISGIITTYNEEKRLEECLQALSFLDELVIVDLGSSDNSIRIAKEHTSKIINHKRVYQVEEILEEFIPKLKYDWVYISDPDEVIQQELIDEMYSALKENEDADLIRLPIEYHYKGKPLKGTIWGGKNYRKSLLNRRQVFYRARVHRGLQFKTKNPKIIDVTSRYGIKHYWADTFSELLEKHKRYIKLEGKSRHDVGQKYSIVRKIYETSFAIWKCLIIKKGFVDGLRGIFLSFFYGWYIWQANNSLKKYEKYDK